MGLREKLVPILFTTAVLGGAGYFIATMKGPCESPIPFRIGTVDPRFRISADALRKAAMEAATTWGTRKHPMLFTYDPNAVLTINLVYDWRQEITEAALSQVARIKELQMSVEKMERELGPRRAAFERSDKAFARELAVYNAHVDRWNRSRGAEGDRDAIMGEERALKPKERALIRERDSINMLIKRHNVLVTEMNTRIDELKRGALNGQFEAGLYSRPGGKPRIDIFQFETVTGLVLTLAHEFGHALGLPHGSNPHSLMFPYLLSQKRELSTEDRRLLTGYCST